MNRVPRPTPCGTWSSPLSAAGIAESGVRPSQPRIAGEYVYWLENRPAENGRSVLVRAQLGEAPHALTPAPFSVRSRVHEYGGGAFAVAEDAVYFVNDADQQIYRQPAAGGPPQALTELPGCRFADLRVDELRRRVIAVCEDHCADERAPRNTLVAVSLRDGRIATLAAGHDFYSSPAFSPDGRQLAWLAWNVPLMPWDGCELWLAQLDADGLPAEPWQVAGGSQESIFQPQFAPDGTLHFVSDRDGFWNIYKYCAAIVHPLTRERMEHGFAQWNLGMSSYGFLAAGTMLAARIHDGISELVEIAPDGSATRIERGCTQIEHLHVGNHGCALLASSATQPQAVIVNRDGRFHRVSAATDILAADYISQPQFIRFPTTDGDTACGWYYPPRNPHCRVPSGEAPPLLVRCHGGPTAMNGNGLEPRIQFWTSRGFAVADVNYRGSSGFGRAYRQSLRGQWGIKDAEDCVAAARHLVARGFVDRDRIAITGSSAGGFTVLCALAFHDIFRAGAVYYGISELESAMRDTHKFEAHYADSLLGPWPEARAVYRARSPLYAASRIRCPVIFFQGLKDKVVPPDQTQRMVEALRANRLPVEYLSFADEGHGFRRRETLQRTLEAELAFYGRVFGFGPVQTA